MEALKIVVGCLSALVGLLLWAMTKMLTDKKDSVTASVELSYLKRDMQDIKEAVNDLRDELKQDRKDFDTWKNSRNGKNQNY